MKQLEGWMMLKVFIGESDKCEGKPLYEHIVLKARELKLAGATVVSGIMGFGTDSHMHTAKVLRLSENLPVIIEMVDMEENLNKIMPFLDEKVKEGLVTLEKIKVLKCGQK